MDIQRISNNVLKDTQSKSKNLKFFTCAKWIPETGNLLLGCKDGALVVWRRHANGLLSNHPVIMPGHNGPVTCVKYLETYNLVCSGSADRTVRIWDSTELKRESQAIQTLAEHGGTITDICTHKEYIITSSTDSTIRVWRADPNRDLMRYPFFTVAQVLPNNGWITCLAVQARPAGDVWKIVCGDTNGFIHEYEQRTNIYERKDSFRQFTRSKTQRISKLGVTKLSLVTQDNFMFALSYENTVRIFDSETGKKFLVVENVAKCRFTDLCWSTATQELFLVDELGYVSVYNIYTEKLLKRQRLQSEPITNIALTRGALQLMSLHRENVEFYSIVRELKFNEFEVHEGPITHIFTVERQKRGKTAQQTDEDVVVRYNAEGKLELEVETKDKKTDIQIYTGSLDNTIRCWDPYDMSQQQVFREHQSEISAMTFCKEWDFLVSGNDDGTIRLWNPDNPLSLLTLTGHSNTVSCLTIATVHNRSLLLSGGFDGCVGIWDLAKTNIDQPHLKMMFQAHKEEVLCLAYNDQSRTFATGGNDCKIKIWSAESVKLVAVYRGHTDSVISMAVDGYFLLSGSEDCTIRVWNTFTHDHVKTLAEHTQPVRDLLVIPNQGYLCSCSMEGKVLLWDYLNEVVVKTFKYPDEFRCLTHVSVEHRVFAGTESCKILVFTLPKSEESDPTASEKASQLLLDEEGLEDDSLDEEERSDFVEGDDNDILVDLSAPLSGAYMSGMSGQANVRDDDTEADLVPEEDGLEGHGFDGFEEKDDYDDSFELEEVEEDIHILPTPRV